MNTSLFIDLTKSVKQRKLFVLAYGTVSGEVNSVEFSDDFIRRGEAISTCYSVSVTYVLRV